MAQRAVVIIGAGIIGCLVASELAARDPDALITVLDRDAVGAGASRRSAGLHLPRGGTPRTRQMSDRSHAYYADLKRRRPAVPIHPVKATVVASPARPRPAIPDAQAERPSPPAGAARLLGHGYLDLAAPEPTSRAPGPGIAIGDGQLAWQISGCHYTDVHKFCEQLAAGLRHRIRFAEGVEVTGLAQGRSRVTITAGTGERITADQVVLAPGPWLTAPAWSELIAPLGLRVKKIVALHVDRPASRADQLVIFNDEDAFLLPLPGRGHWLFSYTCQEWDVDPDRLTAGLSAANVSEASACLRRYSPAMAGAARSGRVFCDAYSPAAEPVVRALDEAGQIVFAGAANGSGYRLAPAIGADTADLLATG